MRVRSLAWADFDGLFALRSGRYTSIARDPNYGMVSNPSPPTPGEFATWFGELHRTILEGRGVSSVATVGGRLVGMCSVRHDERDLETRHVGSVGIELLDGFRGRGIGRPLIAHALRACRGVFEEVRLNVIPVNARARRLYDQVGFEVYGTAPRTFQRGGIYHDYIEMRKRIEGLPKTARSTGPRHRR